MRQFIILVLLHGFADYAFAARAKSTNPWHPDTWEQVRPQILSCRTFLAPPVPVEMDVKDVFDASKRNVATSSNDAVGLPISTNNAQDFRRDVQNLILEGKRDAFVGATIFVTGIDMRSEGSVKADFENALKDLGFSLQQDRINVRVLSIPKSEFKGNVLEKFQFVLDHLVYSLPSIKRDYQKPLKAEVVAGFVTDAWVEPANIVYLYKTLNVVNANLTVINHVATLSAYSIYTQFMLNWLLRPRPQLKALTAPRTFREFIPYRLGQLVRSVYGNETFAKQLFLSLPFVLNYKVTANFTEIVEFLKTHTWDQTVVRFGQETMQFIGTQTLTLYLQTQFYKIMITQGLRGWAQKQVGAQRIESARIISRYLSIPVLTLDALALAHAGTDQPLLNLGPAAINMGHIYLSALAASGLLIRKFPQVLDPAIPLYDGITSFVDTFKTYPLRPLRLDLYDTEQQ